MPPKKLLEIINEYSKVTGYKINIQKSVTFLHATNESAEREIKRTILFTITTKTIKCPRIYLTKEVKDLYTKTLRHCFVL